jgi:hypothetical protein
MRLKQVFSPAVALLVASTIAVTAFAADVSGTWTWTAKSKKGKETQNTLTLKAEGEKLTGELTRGARSAEISNGTIKGDQVSFEVTTERNGNAQTTKYEGKVEGDTIKGTQTGSRKGGGVGRSREWEAKRSK